ncbi:MAG TPA: hypothetical protein VLJ76_11495 [Gaiellaceae bacterium]|nr:hypothetical protein [Gaiellaceae bacterium]
MSKGAKVLVAFGVAGAAFGIATVVQASIPDSHGTINGCYQFAQGVTPKGTLRVIDPSTGESCRFYEHPLKWNANGVGGVYAIAGEVQQDIQGQGGDTIPADNPDWSFVATTAQVTITSTQSMLANITAGLGQQNCFGAKPLQCPQAPKNGANPKVDSQSFEFGYGVCFQNAVGGGEGGNPIINMNQFTGGNNANYNAATYEIGEQDYTGIGTAAPGAGTYNVGYCVQNYGDEDLDNNNWANGYVEVVDGTPNISGVSDAPRVND